MKFIEVAGKKFKLASRLARLYALLIDGLVLSSIQAILLVIFMILGVSTKIVRYPLVIGIIVRFLYL